MSSTSKVLYTPLSMVVSVAGGLVASAVFTQVWKRIGEADQPPPDPDDLSQSTAKVLFAAALQSLIFGLVRAAVNRASARGYKAVTNEAPS
ncbi:DUF4235 domain-containing protein [Mycolicibacterium hippocampi]|uniref:DUF4235 domain-containing protein n=1 Tax=Mycolicibacterium hippocampi TaxID=659824 RepID=A0A7I9ZHA0_9MYCO|nr:DUF4235 domain-containing protein [Mycolicibacterium hippocampi]GFH00223.1 hypothetical protein MHIP_07060 [Mycolicibacterium hippocampi]